MKDPVYQFTETEAKAYDAMRSSFGYLQGTDFACPFSKQGTDFACCMGCYKDYDCPLRNALNLLKKVDEEQDNEI